MKKKVNTVDIYIKKANAHEASVFFLSEKAIKLYRKTTLSIFKNKNIPAVIDIDDVAKLIAWTRSHEMTFDSEIDLR